MRKLGDVTEKNVIHNMDTVDGLKLYPDNFFHCCVTSPPYWGLRDYGMKDQIGLERHPEEFINRLVCVFQEVKRVLRKDGTLWLNMGDSYLGSKMKRSPGISLRDYHTNIRTKELVGIPWMLAFALRDIGFYIRQDIIWHKPNPMPESARDRCTKSHEYIFLLTKSPKYYYNQDAVSHNWKEASLRRLENAVSDKNKYAHGIPGQREQKISMARPRKRSIKGRKIRPGIDINGGNQGKGSIPTSAKANLRSVWKVPVKGYKGAHFATFPERIPYICISAGCPDNGVVLDPFMGAGTTALVARKLRRDYVGFEINPKYIKIAERRLHDELGLFK